MPRLLNPGFIVLISVFFSFFISFFPLCCLNMTFPFKNVTLFYLLLQDKDIVVFVVVVKKDNVKTHSNQNGKIKSKEAYREKNSNTREVTKDLQQREEGNRHGGGNVPWCCTLYN